ncbi:LOW QUALITY PROTEIN: uncharacterized protein LOC118451888 [Egretta garzetta]|nr:LOW QUALITY PROTEIN: uncharacterized protein LOC118451888 [Egretta garzetta]
MGPGGEGRLVHPEASTAKRCKDKHLEEALLLSRALSEALQALGEAEARLLLRCVLAFQMEATGSSSSFQKLEQIVTQLAVGKEALLAQEVGVLLAGLALQGEVLSPGDLQSVCMFMEESSLGRQHWRQNLAPLLQLLAATLCWVLQSQPAPGSTWGYLAVKACLQLFQALPKDVAPLVWSTVGKSEALQSLLGLLLEVVWGKALNKDARLLAGTALSMLVNTAPQPEHGASAVLALFQLPNQAGARELKFGELVVEVPPVLKPDGLEKLVLTRGLLTCCKANILSCQLESFTHKACLLLDVIFPAVRALTKEQDCHYYCFQAPNPMVTGQYRKSTTMGKQKRTHPHLSCLPSFSPQVEGVSESIHSSFRLLLEIYHLECQHFHDQERPLYQEMLQKVISMPWQIKARYVPLCAIVPYVGSQQVLDAYPELPQHLLSCLSTNHLCPAAAEVYKALVRQQHAEQQDGRPGMGLALAEPWALRWLPLLSQALRSPLPILQSNAANHLLAWTLRQLPAAQAPLATQCSGRDAASLQAWVLLLKAQKSVVGALPLQGKVLERLCCCLGAREEGVRLAALGLLCCSPSTNQPLSGTEVRLLREFLPLNLNCDSSSFRQLLQAAVRKALVQLRDSSLAQLRGKEPHGTEMGKGAGQLAQAVGFVEWLLQLSIASLSPGSNYQRKKTALLLLAAVLETCTDTWSPARKKGQPPRTMATLLSYTRQSGCWDFFSQPNLLALLSCLQESSNEVILNGHEAACLSPERAHSARVEASPPPCPSCFPLHLVSQFPPPPPPLLSWQIRDLASELLIRYFPATFPEPIALALFQLAQEALGSPRVQEAEAGAVLMKTILQKSDSDTMKSLALEAEAAPTLPNRGLCFAQHLLHVLQAQYAAACQDLLQAAATAPMHGAIAALRRCLLQVPEVAASMRAAESAQSWQELLTRLITTVRDITSFLLGALQSQQGPGANEQAAAPSFADMGNAIGSLITLGKSRGQQEEEEDSVLLSEEHSLILTCCWVSVKEIGLLLGGLAELLLDPALPAGSGPLLPLPTLQTAARVFQEILLRCRHWGAVEGCSMGFTKFCAALLNHPDTELQAIPQTMLEQGLEALSGPRSSSITRRAAGFPMLFLCIVSGEAPAQARPLLARCVQTLLALATTALPQDWDQTLDLPQVCAFHVLQTLVRGAGLGGALLRHAAPMLSTEALSPVALQLEARGWLLTPAQRCPLVRAAFLQVLALLPASLSPSFAQSIRDAVSTELGSLPPGGKLGCAELQVGSAILHQTMARFLCSEAARLADGERIGTICSLLRQPNPDVQLAILSWVLAGERGTCEELEKALRLTLLESLGSVLQERRDKEFLRLYLEALLHLYRDPSSWSQEASRKLQGSAAACLEMLLHMLEAECPGPDLLFQALCAASLLLAHRFEDEDGTLVERWCTAVEACSQSASYEVLRLAAARSLQAAGADVVQRSLRAGCSSLVPVALRLINVGIHLLQDEEREVRHEASGFASLLRQDPGEPLPDRCGFTLQVLGEGAAAVPGLGCGAQELEQELEVVQGLLVQHGLAPVLSQGDVLGELGPPSRAA